MKNKDGKEMDGPMMGRCMEHLMGDGYSESEAHEMCLLIMDDDGKQAQGPAIRMEPDRVVKYYAPEQKTLRNGDVEAYVSTESIDRMGDVIKAKGWELDSYRKSGSPVLFAHDYGGFSGGIPHIGNAVEMEVQRKGLWSVTRFHEKTQLSREAAVLAREKLMPSWSVGFRPLEKPAERKSEDGSFEGYIFTKQELLEYSLVPVPANVEARSKMKHMADKGIITRATLALFVGPSPQAEEDQGQAEVIAEQFRKRQEEHAVASGFKRR